LRKGALGAGGRIGDEDRGRTPTIEWSCRLLPEALQLGKKGVYTRKRGLDRETNKMLLLKHIEDNRSDGSRFEEFRQVLPALSRNQIQRLLKELKSGGRIRVVGRTNAALWYPGPES
jgi:hypothetical protein